jgi:flagellar biosynthesis protein FlhA
MEINNLVAQAWKAATNMGNEKVILLCDSRLRMPLSEMLSRTVPPLAVIAYDEIVLGTEIETVDTISVSQPMPTENQQQLVMT